MAQTKIEVTKAIFIVRYRAKCEKGDHTGDWRDNEEQALEDALIHQNEQNSHEVNIEVEQIQKYLKKVNINIP